MIPGMSALTQQQNEQHTVAVFQTKPPRKKQLLSKKNKQTINTSQLKAISAFCTARNSKAVLIPKYFILARCTGVCLSIMDVPKWPSISHYINKLNGEKCSPNRQQLVITVMLLSRHNNHGRNREGKKVRTTLVHHTNVIPVSVVNTSLHL